MSLELLLLTADPEPGSVLPSLMLLPHNVRTQAPEVTALLDAGARDAVLLDARPTWPPQEPVPAAHQRRGQRPGRGRVDEGGLVAVNSEWRTDEILLPTAGPAEVDARLRLVTHPRGGGRQSTARCAWASW